MWTSDSFRRRLSSRRRFRPPLVASSAVIALKTRFSCYVGGEFKSTRRLIKCTHINPFSTARFQRLLYLLLLDEVGRWFYGPNLKPLVKEIRPEYGIPRLISRALGIRKNVCLDEHFLVGCLP